MIPPPQQCVIDANLLVRTMIVEDCLSTAGISFIALADVFTP